MRGARDGGRGPTFVVRTPADARRLPWRNGRGVTEELAIGPADASFERDDWAWRISRAAVVEDGPFSLFPGVDRVLVLTEGAGLALRHGSDGATVRLTPLVAHAFPGDVATVASCLAGPVRDLNVMTRRGRVRVRVAVVRTAPDGAHVDLAPGDVVVHAVAGPVAVLVGGPASRRVTLEAGDTLVGAGLAAATSLGLRGSAEGVAVVASIAPVAAGA